MTENVYYKLLRKFGVRLKSYGMHAYCIDYEIGEWIKPPIPNSQLFVFDSLLHAKQFNVHLNIVVFECAVVNPQQILYICPHSEAGMMEKYWSGALAHERFAPTGTYGCDSLKLIKEVSDVLQSC